VIYSSKVAKHSQTVVLQGEGLLQGGEGAAEAKREKEEQQAVRPPR
jgi:hypothetical protein